MVLGAFEALVFSHARCLLIVDAASGKLIRCTYVCSGNSKANILAFGRLCVCVCFPVLGLKCFFVPIESVEGSTSRH